MLFPKHQFNRVFAEDDLFKQRVQHGVDLAGVCGVEPVGQVLSLLRELREQQGHDLVAFGVSYFSGGGFFHRRFCFLVNLFHAAVVTFHGYFAKLKEIFDAGTLFLQVFEVRAIERGFFGAGVFAFTVLHVLRQGRFKSVPHFFEQVIMGDAGMLAFGLGAAPDQTSGGEARTVALPPHGGGAFSAFEQPGELIIGASFGGA